MKKSAAYLILMIFLAFVLCGCNSNKDIGENSDGFTIEEEMIYEDENEENKDSGKPYDKDDDGFVDGWY